MYMTIIHMYIHRDDIVIQGRRAPIWVPVSTGNTRHVLLINNNCIVIEQINCPCGVTPICKQTSNTMR